MLTRLVLNRVTIATACQLALFDMSYLQAPAQEAVIPEVKLPLVRLADLDFKQKKQFESTSAEQEHEVERILLKDWKAGVAVIDNPDVGLGGSMPHGSTLFLPVGQFDAYGIPEARSFESDASLKRLIEIGPAAIPTLLDALDDERPTRLAITVPAWGGLGSNTTMFFVEELGGNPINPREAHLLGLDNLNLPSTPHLTPQLESYRARVGDVCLAAIGQIVGRDYDVVSDPVSAVHIRSPVHSEKLASNVRELWSTDNPKQKVFESLLMDFATRGTFNGKVLDGWHIAHRLQINAAMRLLYYYPEASASLVAQRIDDLDVSNDTRELKVSNGLDAAAFVYAVAWCEHPEIQRALERMLARAKDDDVIDALKKCGVKSQE